MASPLFPTSDRGGAPSAFRPAEQQGAPLLLRELSSAAVYAELAMHARTWHPDGIEQKIWPGSERRKTFYSLRDGGRLQPRHAESLQTTLPHSHIRLWWQHPLAEVLCIPAIGTETLLSFLRQLPPGPVRKMIWSAKRTKASGYIYEHLRPLNLRIICQLEATGSVVALFALLVRMRLAQLEGDLRLDSIAHETTWRMLPRALERSTPILFGMDALTLALDFFFSWQPFADERLTQMTSDDGASSRSWAVQHARRIWEDTRRIPDEAKRARRNRAEIQLLPDDANSNSWWGTFFSPWVVR